MLDGITQVTESDEFVYHEMMSHVPIFSHNNPEKILIIGGGDGGIAREVLRHQHVKHVTMIEIDGSVVDFSQKYMPKINNGAFNNSKLHLKIADGAEFIKNTSEKFDIIIVDSTDPQGPGSVLFTKDFYKDCYNALSPDGILVTQNGVPFMQAEALKNSITFLKDIFQYASCFRATIPTYAFGEMTFGWASNKDYRLLTLPQIQKRFDVDRLEMNYYTPAIHLAAFALPAYIDKIVNLKKSQ
jgi:spermidine synthase